jgi:N-acetylglucosamine malate deacetylase 1
MRALRSMGTALLGLLLGGTASPGVAQSSAGPVVVLAPHPDDETLGCGGVIATRAHEGRRVVVVVLTDGRALLRRFGITREPSEVEVSRMRKDETRRAVRILTDGRGEVVFLDVENEQLVAKREETTRALTALLKELNPAELYVPSPFEGHAEHVATNGMATAACAASGACGDIFEFVVTLKRGTEVATLPRRQVWVDVSAQRAREREALAQFRSHLDVISPQLPKPFEANYNRYLTDRESFFVRADP